jgi:hypothetical protein
MFSRTNREGFSRNNSLAYLSGASVMKHEMFNDIYTYGCIDKHFTHEAAVAK